MTSPKWRNWRGPSAKWQEDSRGRSGDRTGPKWAWAGWPRTAVLAHPDVGSTPISWAWRWCNPKYVWALPFAGGEPFSREVVHKLETKERREIIREKDRLSPRRQPQVEEDVETLPRHPRRRRKTPSKASPWSTVPCLASWWGKTSPWGCKRSWDVIATFMVSIYQSSVEVFSCLRLATVLFGSIYLTTPLEPFNTSGSS
jgi:hypothetical protein